MNLPNYFIADLPPEAVLTPEMIRDACLTLKRNRETYLAHRTTAKIVNTLCEVGQQWLKRTYELRQFVLERGPAETGFPASTLAEGLDNFFSQFSAENFEALLVQDLGHAQRLDGMKANEEELKQDRASMVLGPELLVHFAGGALPNPALMSIVLGLLTRSAQFVKCASGQSFIPRMFAHSLYETEPKLGACLEIAEWKGGTERLEQELFEHTDCLTATGSDETLAAIQKRLPARARFIGYGHKVSFGYVASEMLSGSLLKKTVAHAAQDVIAWNQLGCLSPHLFYVETGGAITALEFAESLAAELEAREQTHPRGELPSVDAAPIASRRSFYEVRAAHSPETKIWCSPGATVWTVVFEADPRFQSSCLNRFVYVKEISELSEALRAADDFRGKVSTVGLAAPENRAPELVNQLARWGVTRACPLGKMQNPPLIWRHDGRPSLGDLVTWTDWEHS